jgi:hypothetical protein
MKRVVYLLVVLIAVLLVSSCAFLKTYYVTSGDTVNGSCLEFSTSNQTVANIYTLAGYTEGTCAAHGYSATHYCSYTSTSGSDIVDFKYYFGSSYTPATISSTCSAMGYTYH